MKTSIHRLALAAAALAASLTVYLAVQSPRAAEKAQPPALRVQSLDKAPEEKTAWGSLRWLLNGKLDPGSPVTLGIATTEPGLSNPLHIHGNSDEIIYILSGTCEQQVGNQTITLKAGDALRIPAGTPHRSKVIGTTPMKAIVVYNTGERQFTPVNDPPTAK